MASSAFVVRGSGTGQGRGTGQKIKTEGMQLLPYFHSSPSHLRPYQLVLFLSGAISHQQA